MAQEGPFRAPTTHRADPRAVSSAANRIARVLRTGGRVCDLGSDTPRVLRTAVRIAREQGKRPARGVWVPGGFVGPRRPLAVHARADELPLGDQVFDVVWAGGLLHRTTDAVRSAREINRITLPGGTVLVALPGPGPRGFAAGTFMRTLEDLGCEVTEGPRLFVVRTPGPRRGGMPITVEGIKGWTPHRVSRLLADLPVARGYELVVKPLRWRKRPHVQAWCEFEERRITVQVPVPFRPFNEIIPYRAKRLPGKGLRFDWKILKMRFERPDELIRYLYLHEYYHWYLREVRGKASAAETACDRFALQRM